MAAKNPLSSVLNADEYAFLARYGTAISQAPSPDLRKVAQAAAVAAASYYHARGITWTEIAKALGVSAGALRDWRGDGAGPVKRRIRPVSGLAAARLDEEIARGPHRFTPGRHTRLPHRDTRRLVLVALGTTKVDAGDFPGEAAAIRRVLLPHGIEVIERCAIELGELKQDLDELRPATVHVTAHFDFSLVHLSAADAKVSAVTTADLTATIRAATTPPDLVVLSGCDTNTVCEALTEPTYQSGSPVLAATGWRGNLNDQQARLFTERFYAGLAGGATVGKAFNSPLITVTTRWPGQGEPYLTGNALAIPFPVGSGTR